MPPLYCPRVTHPDVVETIIQLRQHYLFGPMKIRMYLKRYRDVDISASRAVANPQAARDESTARSATSVTRGGGSVTRSSVPAITCRSASSSFEKFI